VSDTIADVVAQLCAPAFDEPKAGAALWSFHTKKIDRSLEPDEVVALVKKGTGVFVLELVWDEDLDLVQRGEGIKVRTLDDLEALRDGRFKHLVDPQSPAAPAAPRGRDPSMAMTAPKETKARTSTPWHPATMKTTKR
jgi:hypothetical protein